MSYDICCIVMGLKEDFPVPETKKIIVETEYSSSHVGGRYSKLYPFMTMQEGTWINLLTPGQEHLGAFGICDADFDYPAESINYPQIVGKQGRSVLRLNTSYCFR